MQLTMTWINLPTLPEVALSLFKEDDAGDEDGAEEEEE